MIFDEEAFESFNLDPEQSYDDVKSDIDDLVAKYTKDIRIGLDEEQQSSLDALTSNFINILLSQRVIFEPSNRKENVLVSSMASYESILFVFRSIIDFLSAQVDKTMKDNGFDDFNSIVKRITDGVTDEAALSALEVLVSIFTYYQFTINHQIIHMKLQNDVHADILSYYDENKEEK